jgi:hypothetical protein
MVKLIVLPRSSPAGEIRATVGSIIGPSAYSVAEHATPSATNTNAILIIPSLPDHTIPRLKSLQKLPGFERARLLAVP